MVFDDELTYKIIGCAIKVPNTLGNGFQEVAWELEEQILLWKIKWSLN